MARLKTLGASRTPNTAASVKTPRKIGPALASKGILKKKQPSSSSSSSVTTVSAPNKKKTKQTKQTKTAAPVKAKKTPVQKHRPRKPAAAAAESDDDDEQEQKLAAANDDAADNVEAEAEAEETEDDDDVVETDDEAADGAKKPRKVNHYKRRLKRMALLQKSAARLGTEAGFRRMVKRILDTSTTAAMSSDRTRFTRSALQNIQASVESILQTILADTADQVYTITGRGARISAAPIAITAEQRLRNMAGAQFINNFREACEL